MIPEERGCWPPLTSGLPAYPAGIKIQSRQPRIEL